jgi:ribosomal protein L9
MEKFDGGGHLNNAGAQIAATTNDKVKNQLLEYLGEAVQEEKPMKVILIKDLRGKGKKGEVIDVAAGYGNFLLSNKTAIEATSENLSSIEADRLKKEDEERKTLEEMKILQGMVEKLPVKVFVKIGENGKLFGKINSKQISDQFKKQHNVAIDKRKIQVTNDINSLGSHTVNVKLHKNVVANLEVIVVEE